MRQMKQKNRPHDNLSLCQIGTEMDAAAVPQTSRQGAESELQRMNGEKLVKVVQGYGNST